MDKDAQNKSSPGSLALTQLIATYFLALAAALILKACLYLRLGPYGSPFVIDRIGELFIAVFFEAFGLALMSLPFFAIAFFVRNQKGFGVNALKVGHIAICFISLIATHADNEIQRFMGIHISLNYLQTYARLGSTPAVIGYAIADDFGGSYCAYFLLVVPVAFAVIAIFQSGRKPFIQPFWQHLAASVGIVLFLLAPAIAWNIVPADSPRLSRIRPLALIVLNELKELFPKNQKSHLSEASVERYQSFWRQRDSSKAWRFNMPEYPLRKSFSGSCPKPTAGPWNFILIQLETFRAKDMKLFNSRLDVSPTPFIDGLGHRQNAAYWANFFCNGLPTVYSFMSINTGLFPHSRKQVATAFKHTKIEGLTEFLRKRGYLTVFFSVPNPAWDNESYWLDKWYDTVFFNPDFKELDRPLFKEAAAYLKEHGDKRPFWVSIVSLSNHIPFRSPEPKLDITDGKTIFDRLRNTMRYTDDVVREFIDSVKNEPWFSRTIVIITGDHGFDLGDRGVMLGHSNLKRESTWVPLIVLGDHPSIPKGEQSAIGSHMDIAPTVFDLIGICDENSFSGHSLIGADATSSYAAAAHEGNAMLETQSFSAHFPKGALPMLFYSRDTMQENNIASDNQKTVFNFHSILDALLEVMDWTYEHNKVIPN